MRDPVAWLEGLPEPVVRLWERFGAETPFGPGALNHMLARLCAVVNWSGINPAEQGESHWMPGTRHHRE